MNEAGKPPMNSRPKPDADLNRTRHWIAKCLVMGRTLEYIRGSLTEKGLCPQLIEDELKQARESPYIKGGRTVYERDIQSLTQVDHKKSSTRQSQITAPFCSPLEEGDYLPTFTAEGKDERKLHIQSKANRRIILVLPSIESTDEEIDELIRASEADNIFVVTSTNHLCGQNPRAFNAIGLKQLFSPQNIHHIIHVERNLKIENVQTAETYQQAANYIKAIKVIKQINNNPISAPLLVVPDVISTDLCHRLIDHGQSNRNRGHIADRRNKSRFHIAPSPALIKELDDKLCRSLLPEIEKAFYSSVSHRETYKICHYDADQGGNFAVHRDTIEPYRHRRYGFSLALNDNFSGGGINFPEYNDSIISIKPGSAIVFPGSLFHQVLTIQEGHRWVLISFLFTEAEARNGKDESNRFNFRNRFNQLNVQSILPKSQA